MLHATVVIVRVLTAGMAVCAGLLVGPFAFPESWGGPSERAVLLVMALSVLLPLVLLAGSAIQVQRGERVLREAVREGAAELWGGDVRGTGSPGLVEYSAPPRHGDPPAAVCVTNGPGGQGRVVVPVPVPLPRGTPVALLLHPRREEVAVLDERVDHDALRDAAGWDPAWTGIRMPGRVAALGGGGVMLALALLGLAVGAAVSFSILALVPGAVGA